MARPRHPNKEIEAAVKYAEAHGWTYARPGSHAWGVLHCVGWGTAEGHRILVFSTPRNPFNHAKDIRRAVGRCNHVPRSEP